MTSSLWGDDGELWNVTRQLNDFTYVGYMLGDEQIPDYPVWKSITDPTLGAVADDNKSDVAAFLKAIAECPPNHAIFVPNGKYIIDGAIPVTQNNIVIRGESREGTVLFFPKHMNEIEKTKRSHTPFITFEGGSHRGIERLSLVFRDETKATIPGCVPLVL